MAKTTFVDGDKSQGIVGTRILAAFLNKIFTHRHDGKDEDGSAPLDYAADTGAANAYAVALSPALTAHVTGLPIHFLAANANTGASTVNINGLGAVSIVMPDGTSLGAGAIKAGQVVTVIYTGTYYQLLSKSADGALPAGSVIHVAQNTAPAGYLKANGALVNRTTYAALFGAIGTTFGAGDGATTFALPDLRGEFVRGWDDSRGVDSGRAFGSAQADDFKSHTHSITNGFLTGAGAVYYGGTGGNMALTTNTNATGGTETRPRNVALLACIKY